ncbi:MAG: FGGY-family carbohydrate kinase [Lachnospiraceae bacterium]|nr:FGGY-family carbohydrate kinase [Lachnospiraceae bacterium]
MEGREVIASGNAYLGIEFGSTRIKGVLIDSSAKVLAMGSHEWENQLKDGIWTYSMEAITTGLQDCYSDLLKNVKEQYDIAITRLRGMGVSAMMHGYLAFNEKDELLTEFRTWRNTITEEAANELSKEFSFNIPQRWSVAHLYQAILNKEEHVKDVAFFTTLAGYIHWKLTGNKVLGIGDASGMFPIDSTLKDYHENMMKQFDVLAKQHGFEKSIADLLPKVLVAGENAGTLTEEGAKLLDVTGQLQAGCAVCPPEGDAGTGMTATNSVRVKTGNVSAGTSVFAMVVLEKALKTYHQEIDMVTTPSGEAVAMVHCNNCTSDLNAWVQLFCQFSEAMGVEVDKNKAYTVLFEKALQADADGGGLLSYNYFSGESITGFDEGRPIFARAQNANFNLANFMRVHLFTALGALKIGLDILLKDEGVSIDTMYGHGGFFKTPVVGQRIMAAAMNAPVATMTTAGEGGPWGMAVLAAYMMEAEGESLADYLSNHIFCGEEIHVEEPKEDDVKGFDEFLKTYKNGLEIEKAAVKTMK